MTDNFYIQKCLELAAKGYPDALPNPMVGCVIVLNNKIIGKGYHQKFGYEHAEVHAINSVKDKSSLQDATLYVNLEPCSHFGKTPPCSDFIIENKLKKVVIGYVDTHSKVNGKGIERLKNAGIEVITNVLAEDCISFNKRFYTFHNKKRPYIILKWAESQDGFIAPKDQKKSFWMTGNLAKRLVHQWRSIESGILIGKNTAVKDNPLLTNRYHLGNSPIRFVIDKNLSLSSDLNIFNEDAPTFTICKSKKKKNHIEVNFDLFIEDLLTKLHQINIYSLIVEGGRNTIDQFINSKQWDEARVFQTKKVLKEGISKPTISIQPSLVEMIGDDKLSYYINP